VDCPVRSVLGNAQGATNPGLSAILTLPDYVRAARHLPSARHLLGTDTTVDISRLAGRIFGKPGRIYGKTDIARLQE
jgi:hypothetical protein